jgi:hypothetical protein
VKEVIECCNQRICDSINFQRVLYFNERSEIIQLCIGILYGCNGYHCSFIFGRHQFQILFKQLIALIEVLRSFTQSLQANTELVTQIRQRPLTSTKLPVQHSLIIISFDIMYSEIINK